MVEVFVTNVTETRQANRLIERIQQTIPTYRATFDLQDCDRILRIQSATGQVNATDIILILEHSGYKAELLPD